MIGWKNLKIKCLENYVCFICRKKGIGEVVKRDILKIEVEEVIKLKSFYVIEVLDYLKLDDEKKRVVEWFEERFDELVYFLVCNNCECLVFYILMGNLFLE